MPNPWTPLPIEEGGTSGTTPFSARRALGLQDSLNIGPQSGWTALEKASFVDTANSFFGARNLPLLGVSQTNYFQFLGHDDNNTVPNIVVTYAALTDNHAAGTRTSSVGLESDIFHTGAGTTTGEAGVIGFAQALAGVVTDQHGVQGQIANTGGTVANSAAVYGIYTQSGGAITNSYAGLFAGPNISGGTVTNNYGVYIGRVGSSGTSKNYQLYVEGSGAGNPVVVDSSGKVVIVMAVPVNSLDVTGTVGITGAFGCNGAAVQVASIGYGTPTNGAKQASFDATAITLPNLAKATAQLIIDLKAIGFLAA